MKQITTRKLTDGDVYSLTWNERHEKYRWTYFATYNRVLNENTLYLFVEGNYVATQHLLIKENDKYYIELYGNTDDKLLHELLKQGLSLREVLEFVAL